MSNITISGSYGHQVSITLLDQDPAVAVLLEQNADVTYEGSLGVGAVNGDAEAAWSITNLGVIAGGTLATGGPGIWLAAGGSIANGSSLITTASIGAYEYGVQIVGAAGTVTNYGTITGTNDTGVQLTDGGSITNGFTGGTSALISGGKWGISAQQSATIVNYATIAGGNTPVGVGIYLTSGGSITNGATAVAPALIEGYYGIKVTAGNTTITNDGTVAGIFDGIMLAGDGSVGNYGTITAANETGILILGTGAVTNGSASDTTAAIYGGSVGVYVHAGVATVVNYGTITTPFGNGVYVFGGTVTNGSTLDTTALISAPNIGIWTGYNTHTATVANFGTVSGGYLFGVDLENSGQVTNGASNDTDALITSGDDGVYMYGTTSALMNFATIATTGAFAIAGVSLANSGSLQNGSTADHAATIYGYKYGIAVTYGAAATQVATIVNYGAITGGRYGVTLSDGGTVINAGTISGGSAAIVFGSGGADRLAVAPGAVFVGDVTAGGTGGNTLELEANGAGTLADIGTSFVGFGNVVVDAGAGWTITDGIGGAVAVTLDGAGLALPGTGLNAGTSFDFEHAGGPDTLTLSGLAAQNSFANAITDVSFRDSFVLPGFDLTGDTASFDGAHTLTIEDSGHNTVFSFSDFTVKAGESLSFIATGDVVAAACYRRGTHILTASGDRPIETLRIGDAVPTLFGGLQRIKWIGRRGYAPHFVAGNRAVLPVLIRAEALGAELPTRDLYVSPKHAMFIDGVLVPAELLVNELSVLQPPAAGPVEYFHVEFDAHDVILAEGAASESFVDCDNRGLFHNAAEFSWLHPDANSARWSFCARRVEHGAILEKIRRRIDARAGLRPEVPHHGEQLGMLVGNLEHADASGIVGWAFNPEQPGTPVLLEIVGDGVVLETVPANRYRDDLLAAGLGRGRCGFSVRFEPPLRAVASLLLRRAADGALLGSRILALAA
jgi:hypothetical protein